MFEKDFIRHNVKCLEVHVYYNYIHVFVTTLGAYQTHSYEPYIECILQ